MLGIIFIVELAVGIAACLYKADLQMVNRILIYTTFQYYLFRILPCPCFRNYQKLLIFRTNEMCRFWRTHWKSLLHVPVLTTSWPGTTFSASSCVAVWLGPAIGSCTVGTRRCEPAAVFPSSLTKSRKIASLTLAFLRTSITMWVSNNFNEIHVYLKSGRVLIYALASYIRWNFALRTNICGEFDSSTLKYHK